MSFPGEEVISTAINKFGDSIIQKMDEAEEKRNRAFSLKIKELEFYKGNYDKEIKNIFDGWFGLLQNTLIAKNDKVDSNVKNHFQRELDKSLKPEKIIELKIQTMKYCGTETGKALALYSQITYDNMKKSVPTFVAVYAICLLLATMKKEILGQDIEALTILKILLNDYEEQADIINEAQAYVEERRKELFPVYPDEFI